MNDLLTSEIDEKLMLSNLLKCYGTRPLGFRVSKEHYRYLGEQIVSLRQHLKRMAKHGECQVDK